MSTKKRKYKYKTPITDNAATDGWSGDAAAVPVEVSVRLEQRMRAAQAENRRLRLRIRELIAEVNNLSQSIPR